MVNRKILAGILYFILAFQLSALNIVKDQKAMAIIVTRNNPSVLELIPAKTVQEYVKKVTGVELQISEEKEIKNSDSNLIIVGDCEFLKKQGIDMSVLKRDGYHIISNSKYLVLAGRDKCDPAGGKDINFMMINNVWGTLNSVNVFLEDYIGVRWFMPGNDGEVFKKTTDLSIPDNISRTETPFFWWARGGYAYTALGRDALWSRRNSFRTGILCPSIPGRSIFHSWRILMPAEEYFKPHPEYFRMLPDGSRSAWENMICTSNKDVPKIAIEKIKNLFDKGYEIMVLGQSDGYNRCLCPNCEAMDQYRDQDGIGVGVKGKPCERIHLFNYEIINSLSKSYPSNYIMINAYGPILYPSAKINSYSDNTICNVAPATPENIKMWQDKSKIKNFSCWFYWWRQQGGVRTTLFPVYSPYKVADEIKNAARIGIIGATFCFGGENFGNEGPSYYVLGRLLRNPDINVQAVLNEYYQLFYEDAANIMQEYFETLYPMMDKAAEVKPAGDSIIYFDKLNSAYPVKQLGKCKELLEKAQAKTQDEKIKKRIRLSEYNLLYTIYTLDCYVKYKEYRKNPSIDNLSNLETSVKKREDYISLLFSPEELKKQSGLPTPFDTFGKNGVLYGNDNELAIPFKTDFQKLKGKKDPLKIPEAIIKKADISPLLDGKQKNACWQNAVELTMFNQLDLAPSTRTIAKVAYDNNNAYFAFKCDEPEIQNIKMPKKNRNDDIWAQDCIEIFIMPYKKSSDLFHFIFAPTDEGSVNIWEAKQNNRQADLSYSSKCKTFCSINKEQKYWTLEISIPLSALGINNINYNDVWRVGLYRSRFVEKNAEFMAWSPTLCTNYAVPERFGFFIFN